MVVKNAAGDFKTIDLTEDHEQNCARVIAELSVPGSQPNMGCEILGRFGGYEAGYNNKSTPDILEVNFAALLASNPAFAGYEPHRIMATSDGILKVYESDYHLKLKAGGTEILEFTEEEFGATKTPMSNLFKENENISSEQIIKQIRESRIPYPLPDDCACIIHNFSGPAKACAMVVTDGHGIKKPEDKEIQTQ